MKAVLLFVFAALLLTGSSVGAGAVQAAPWSMQVDPSGSPPHELHKQGIPLEDWMDLFTSCLQQLELSIPGGGLRLVADETFTEHKRMLIEKENRYTTYGAVIDGLSLYVRAFEDHTVTDVYLYLRDEAPIDGAVLEAQLTSFPLVIRACVYACEVGGISGEEMDLVLEELCPDLPGTVGQGIPVQNTLLLRWPEYTFHYTPALWGKWALFSANWLR